MKILAIIGSPRKKGNTNNVVQRVKEKLLAIDAGIGFESVYLKDCDLKMCTGCFNCFAKGPGTCPLKDDRTVLEKKMKAADGIIFAAPTYAMGVPALMKNFIDRFAYTSHRPCFFDKAFLLVSTVGGLMGLRETLGQLSLLAAGGKSTTKLGVTCSPVTLAGFEKRAEKNIRKASEVFYRDIRKDVKKAPRLADWAWFSSFKAFTGFSAYQKVSPADHEYYKDKEYFYPIEGHPIRRFEGVVIKGMMKAALKLLVRE